RGGLHRALYGALHEQLLHPDLLFLGSGHALHVVAVGMEVPGEPLVVQVEMQQANEALLERRVLYAHDRLDALLQVAPLPVRTADVDERVALVVEVVDAAVLQETVEDADDADVLAVALQPRPQAAVAPHDQ